MMENINNSFDDIDRLLQITDFADASREDIKSLQDKLKQLQTELDEARSLVTVAECEKENVIETEQRKCKEEVASVQRIMEEAVGEAVRNATSRYEKEISQLQKNNEKLESELVEIKNKDRSDIAREGVLAVVTKSLKRVGNLGGPLPFTSASGETIENLEESMRKAQDDAEMLRSLVVPLEEEIKALKDKLRSTDEQLRQYERAFADLVKGLGSDALSEMAKGKGPAEVVEHLDDKLTSLSQGLQAEKASRSDLEMYVAVLNTQKAVMQEDMDKIKLELQEVCQLLEKEKKEHAQLKRTWQMANDQFLEAQRLQIMDMRRMQSVLSPEQQRQISEMKRKDEQKLELERQIKRLEKKDKEEGKTGEGDRGPMSPLSSPPSVKVSKSSPVVNHRLLSKSSKCSEEEFPSPTSVRAQSIPENLNVAVHDTLSEKRSLSSSALNGLVQNADKSPSLVPIFTSPVKELQLTPSTPKKLPSLTQDQLKALSDRTPELEVRKTLLDSARAELESISLVGKRLVTETEWQLLDEELRHAREKLGQPCEMCSNYELRLQQVQRSEGEQRQKASNSEQILEKYKTDLNRERDYRQEMEQKFDEVSKECESKANQLFKSLQSTEKYYTQIKSDYDECRKEFNGYQSSLTNERESLKNELLRLQNENDLLLGKHIAEAQQMENEEINLPNSVDDLQLYCLQKREELIATKAAKEKLEGDLKSDIQMLKNQLTSEQTAKERLEDTLTQEIDSLRNQLGTLKSIEEELSVKSTQGSEKDQQITTLIHDLNEKKEKIAKLKMRIEELTTAKVELEKIRQSNCEVRWQHDEDASECNLCKKTFQNRKEKMHCSHCGKIFCMECLSRTINSGPKQRQFKVCNVCHTLLNHETAPYFSSDPPQTPH